MFLSRPAVLLDAVVTFNKNNTKRENIFYFIITIYLLYIYTHSYLFLFLVKTLYTFTPSPHHIRVACRKALIRTMGCSWSIQHANLSINIMLLFFETSFTRVSQTTNLFLVSCLKKTSSNVVSVMPQSFIFSASALVSITLNTLARSTSPRGISYV